MDAAQALADLTEISSQIEAAVLAEVGGKILASTFADEAKGERVARAALDLLAAAEQASGRPEGESLAQLEAATPEGSVFLVRDGEHVVAAVTGPQPTVGLVFYDLKTCLRLVAQEQAEAPEAKPSAPRGRKQRGEDAES